MINLLKHLAHITHLLYIYAFKLFTGGASYMSKAQIEQANYFNSKTEKVIESTVGSLPSEMVIGQPGLHLLVTILCHLVII